jgi:hypothetical protein
MRRNARRLRREVGHVASNKKPKLQLPPSPPTQSIFENMGEQPIQFDSFTSTLTLQPIQTQDLQGTYSLQPIKPVQVIQSLQTIQPMQSLPPKYDNMNNQNFDDDDDDDDNSNNNNKNNLVLSNTSHTTTVPQIISPNMTNKPKTKKLKPRKADSLAGK